MEEKSQHCRFDVAHLLNAKQVDGSKISPCKKCKKCRSNHSALKAITKSTASKMAEKLNPTLRDSAARYD
jgi:hypothetical protein